MIVIPFAFAWLTAAVNASVWSGVGGIFDDNGISITTTSAPAIGWVHFWIAVT